MNNNDKYMIVEKADLANERIDDIRENLIERIENIASAIRAFGVPVTKPVVLIALKNPSAILETRNKIQEKEIAERRATMGDDMFEKVFGGIDNEKMTSLCNACNEITGGDYTFIHNGTPITSAVVLNWFDINENGHAFIPDAVIESIRAEFRKYITTAIGKDLRDMQIDVAKKLESIYNQMRKIDDMPKKCLDYDAKGVMLKMFPGGLFEYKETPTGYMQIIPRNINFDPVQRDEIF